jgi:hypothetical protein
LPAWAPPGLRRADLPLVRDRSVDLGDSYLRRGMVAEYDALLASFSQPP